MVHGKTDRGCDRRPALLSCPSAVAQVSAMLFWTLFWSTSCKMDTMGGGLEEKKVQG